MYLHACSIYSASNKCARHPHGCTFENRALLFRRRCKISERAWRPDQYKAQQRPHYDCRRFFCARILALWRVAQEHPRVRRSPCTPVRQSCAIRHPYLLGGRRWRFLSTRSLHKCNTPSIRPKFAPLHIVQWLSPLYTPTPASLHVSPVTTLTWPKPARSKSQVAPNEQRPEFLAA